MTRIDFYGLPQVRPEARERFAVRLVTRAWREGLRSLLLLDDEPMLARLDQALWTEDTAFLPHADIEAADGGAPVLLATPARLPAQSLTTGLASGVLINLTSAIPENFAAFDRVAEILCQDEDITARGREHYRFYRERGYPLEYHDLGRERTR